MKAALQGLHLSIVQITLYRQEAPGWNQVHFAEVA